MHGGGRQTDGHVMSQRGCVAGPPGALLGQRLRQSGVGVMPVPHAVSWLAGEAGEANTQPLERR